MTLREKYKVLTDDSFVKNMVVRSVYGSMQLEEQGVLKERIEALYDAVKKEKKTYPKRMS